VRRQIEAELTLIAELKYEHYFLTVWDLVCFARRRGILCQGRGSAANSAVCYCLGVTAVDPARIDLLFERFISRERNEPPDIDVDFEHERREEVFQYIYEKYGRERAGITAEVITYRPRSAVRDVGKALGLSLDRVDALAKALEWWSDEAVPDEAIRAAGLDPRSRTVQMLVRLVRQLLGFPRHLSQHVGGFVITESPLCEIVPLENGAMPGRTFIEWDKDDIDALGILKVDCLALGMLTALSRCFKLLNSDEAAERRSDEGAWNQGNQNDGEDLPRSDCVAKSHGAGQGSVSRHYLHAGFGEVRPDQPDAPRRGIDPIEHRRRTWTAEPNGLHPISADGARLADGTANSVDPGDGTQLHSNLSRIERVASGDRPRAPSPDPQPGKPPEISPSSLRRSVASSLPQPLIPRSLLDLPPEDPAVYDMICAADTVGVFQIESRAQMSMLPRLKPCCFYDLVIEVAIVRPGPIQGGMIHPYLRRRNGLEPAIYPSGEVRKVLEKTLGVPLFQEQVMRLAVVAAGFTPGEADRLRRAMAAWRRSGQIEKFQLKLMKGMLANGYSKGFAEQIYKQIRGFGEYGFPESHAASFALLVYASAWLKRYHPAAFCAALLNSQPLGFYTPGQLVRDALNHGVPVLPVDVNYSNYDCTLEQGSGIGDRGSGIGKSQHPVPRSPIPDPCLRLGLRLVRGLSAEKVRGIEAARRAGPVTSIRRLARRGDVSREALVRLAAADAFRSLGLNRRQALWHILALADAEPPLFAELEPDEPAIELPAMSLDETVVQDYDALGFSLNAHPIGLVRPELNALKVAKNGQLKRMRNGQPVAVAGLVTVRQRPGTAKGMVFMTLEDETGMANLVIRPNIWERERRIARYKIALIAEGHVERQGEVIHVMVRRLHDLSARLANLTHRSRDFH
jgi:error-prone DNA polymerase